MFKETGISYRESIINCALIRSPKPLHFDLMESFINDSFVQYPNNPDDHSFSSSARLASEEAILRCEEERFELDIVIETAKFTIGYFQKFILNSYSSSPLNLTSTSANFHSVIRSTLIRWTIYHSIYILITRFSVFLYSIIQISFREFVFHDHIGGNTVS